MDEPSTAPVADPVPAGDAPDETEQTPAPVDAQAETSPESDTDEPPAEPPRFTLDYKIPLLMPKLAGDGDWARGGSGFSFEVNAGFGIPKVTLRLGKPESPWLMMRPYVVFAYSRDVVNLKSGAEGYLATSSTDVASYDVLRPAQVKVGASSLSAGGVLKIMHPYGFADLGVGVRMGTSGRLAYHTLQTTDGDECELDAPGSLDNSVQQPFYLTGRYGVWGGGRYSGFFAAIDAKYVGTPSLTVEPAYNLTDSLGNASSPTWKSTQALEVGIALGFGA